MNINHYETFLKDLPFAYAFHKMIFDEQGKPLDYVFLDVNKAFEDMTGLKAENILNKKITEAVPDILNDAFNWIDFYGNLVLNKETKEFEQFAAVQQKWFKVYVTSMDDSHFVTLFTDTSVEHLLAQTASMQYESILDHLPALVFYKDAHNNYIRVNKYIADNYGKKKEELEGTSVYKLHNNADAKKYHEDDLKVIRSGKAELHIEEHWETKDGIKWVSTSKIPYIDERGEITGVIGIAIDITESKVAEEKLMQMFNETEKMNRLMIGREERILELKQQVNDLLVKYGEAPRYKSIIIE